MVVEVSLLADECVVTSEHGRVRSRAAVLVQRRCSVSSSWLAEDVQWLRVEGKRKEERAELV